MNQAIDTCLVSLNSIGRAFCNHAAGAFVQTALLVILLFALDLLLRKRVRAVFRYCVWLLVLVKLVLPPTLSLPSGIGYWLGDRLPATSPMLEQVSRPTPPASFERPQPVPVQASDAVPPVLPSMSAVRPDASVVPTTVDLTPITWQAVLFLFWAAGVVAFAALLAQRLRFVRGLVVASAPAGGDLLGVLEECRRQMGVRQPVGLRTLDTLPSPAVCGLRRPAILMPTALVEKLSPEGLRAALIHELAHIKRADLWINALQTFLQVIYFYNPFVWLANAIIRRTCEEAVDETVLVTLGGRAKDYSNTLIDISEMAFWKADFGLRLIGVAESRRALQGRIRHMLTRPIPKSTRIGALGTIAILIVAALLLPMARAEKSSKGTVTAGPVTMAGATGEARLGGASDTIVDPNTGLKFTVAKRVSAENDVIIHNNTVHLSPNGKFLLWRGWVTPLDGGKPWRLQEKMDSDRNYAAWSPDGKLIAYRSGLAIWLQPVAPETGQSTGPARKLVDDPANWWNGMILWSADSEQIMLYYYERGNRPTEKCVSVRDGRLMQPPDHARFSLWSADRKRLAYFKPGNSVWTAPAEGGATRLAAGTNRWGAVTRVPPPGVEGWGMGTIPLWWSPDSEWLLCGESWRGYLFLNLIFVRLADRREVALKFPERVGDIGFPAVGLGVSSDARKLLFFKNSHDLRLATKVAPIRGGGFAELPFSRQFDYIDIEEVRAPERGGLVFTGYKQHKPALCVAPAGGGQPVEVKLNVSFAGDPDFWLVSPDGKQLLVAKYATRGSEAVADFYVIPISLERAQSTGPATLIFKDYRPPRGGGESVAWSPDSSRLAVCARGQGDGDLWVVSADGSPPKQLTQSPEEVEQSPTWSPDGKFIAYCANAAVGVGVNLYAVPAEGGVPKRLWTWTTPTGRGEQRRAWFPESKEIAVASGDGVLAVAVADGAVRPFLKLPDVRLTWLWWLQWSPDGRALALFGGDDSDACQTVLFRASDRKIELLSSDPLWKIDLGWTGDSQALFCVDEQPDRIRPAALVYAVDLVEAWTQAKNSVAGKLSPASAASTTRRETPPLVNGEFRDDFEDADTRYWTFSDVATEGPDRLREVQNGVLVLQNTRATIGVPEWTNYVVTVKMCIKRARSEVGMGTSGVRFRSGEHGEYCLSAPPDKKNLWFGVRYRGADQQERTGVLSEPPYNFYVDTWHMIQAEVRGPHIMVSVDGRLITDVSDESCTQGAVALIAGPGARVCFDDFSVRLLP